MARYAYQRIKHTPQSDGLIWTTVGDFDDVDVAEGQTRAFIDEAKALIEDWFRWNHRYYWEYCERLIRRLKEIVHEADPNPNHFSDAKTLFYTLCEPENFSKSYQTDLDVIHIRAFIDRIEQYKDSFNQHPISIEERELQLDFLGECEQRTTARLDELEQQVKDGGQG